MSESNEFEIVESPQPAAPETPDRRNSENRPGSNQEERMSLERSDSPDELLRSNKKIAVNDGKKSKKDPGAKSSSSKRTLPNINQPGGWAADQEDLEETQEEKQARRETKKALKAQKLEAHKARVEEAKKRGDPPSQPCHHCGGEHWTEDCLVPAQVNIGSKDKAKRGRADTLGSPQKPARKKSHQNIALGSPTRGSSPATSTTSGGVVLTVRPKQSKSKLGPSHKQESKTVPTRRKEKVGTSTTRSTEAPTLSEFADGKWLYLKMPAALRGAGNEPNMRAVMTGIATMMDQQDVTDLFAYDDKGWMAKCRTPEAVEANKSKQFLIRGHTVTTSRYHAVGPQAYFSRRCASGHIDYDLLAQQIAGVLELRGTRFWLGYEEVRGVIGHKAVVVFESSPGMHKFEFPVGRPGPGHVTSFSVRFVLANLVGVCDVCKEGHSIFDCPDIQTLAPTEATSSFLLQGRPAIV